MPLSVIYGNETFLVTQAVKKLQEQVVDPAMKELTHVVIEKPNVDQVIEAVSAVRFNLGGSTLIEIQDFDLLEKTPASSTDEKQLEILKEILKELDDTKYVLFVTSKMNRRIKFPKWLTSKDSGAKCQEFKVLNFWQTGDAVDAIIQYARQNEISIDPHAAMMLVEFMGVELQPLINEVQKLSVYAAGKTITSEDVMTLSGHNDNTFAMLNDWITEKNRAEVFNTLNEILLTQHPMPIFSLTQTVVNNVFQLKLWQMTGLSVNEMAALNKKKPFKITKDLEAYRSVSFDRVKTLKEKVLTYEHKMKTGELNGQLALEMLMGV